MRNTPKLQIKITLANKIQSCLFNEELLGQLSDGYWENARHADWLWNASIMTLVGPEPKIEVDQSAYVGKTGFGFTKLIPIVGDRMIEIGKRFDPDYNERKLRKDLRQIGKVIRSAKYAPVRNSRPSYPDMGD